MKAIVLAGGFGTRLQSVVKDVPKPMAEINKKPFLTYLLERLNFYGFHDVTLSVGYKQESIINHFKDSYKDISLHYCKEDTPLGTGGAIKKALEMIRSKENILVLNGDTFFDIDLKKFYNLSKNAPLTLALKEMENFDRYGSVEVKNGKITAFREKKFVQKGLINTGVYSLHKTILENIPQKQFSFETFLEQQKEINYSIDNGYFVDIGVPQDYYKAQVDLKDFF